MSQVVFPPDVGDLLGLHGLQLGTVCDTMAQATAERAASLPCEDSRGQIRFESTESVDKRLYYKILTSNVQHGFVSRLENLEDGRNPLLGFD